MDTNGIMISVLVVVRNEAKTVGRTLSSILDQDFDHDRMEIIVIDGMSTDNTRAVVNDVLMGTDIEWRAYDNPNKTLAAGWNIGIQKSRGEYIVRIDAHAEIPPNYLKMNLKVADEVDAACVGGPMETRGEGFWGGMIAGVLSSLFGVGRSFRTVENYNGYVDTIAYGMYKREYLLNVGLLDENMKRGQDWDLNHRIQKIGGRFYFDPSVRTTYYCTNSLWVFMKKAFFDGYWIAAIFEKHSLRHLVPFFFVLSIILLTYLCSIRPGHTWYIYRPLRWYLGCYYFIALLFSLRMAAKNGLKAIVFGPFLFTVLHVGRGLGTLWGIVSGVWLRTKTQENNAS